MKDVARTAGVAQSTVSYVLSGSRSISPQTRRQVERAIEMLGYTPHAAAQALRGDKTDTLVLSLPAREGIGSVVIGMYVLELAIAARRRGLDLLLSTEADHPEKALETIVRGRRADGVLLMSIAQNDPRINVALDAGASTVAIGAPSPPSTIGWVDFDFKSAIELSVAHLAALGHSSILYVGPGDQESGSEDLYVARSRAGLLAGARRLDLHTVEVESARDPIVFERRLAEALSSSFAPTGIIAMGVTNLGLMNAVVRRHLGAARAAQDVVVAGWAGHDGSPLAGQTYIGNAVDVIADRAIELVAASLRGEPVESGYVPMSLERWDTQPIAGA